MLPGALPLVGHLPVLLNDAVGTLRRSIDTLGPAVWIRFGARPPVLFLLESDSFELLKNKSLTMKGAFSGLERMIGESTIIRDGTAHSRVRGALNPSFSMRGIVSSGVGQVMASTVSSRVDSWVHKREVAVLKETQELALDIILRVAGVPTEDLALWHRKNRELAFLLLPFRVDIPGLPYRRALQAADWIDGALLDIVKRARSEPHGHSLTHSMVAARDDQGQGLSDQELIDNLRILLFAGHETTASVLAWLTIQLAQQPQLFEMLCAESCRSECPAVPVSIAEAKALPFGEALFREAMRRYAPIWMTRRLVVEDIVYRGRHIPAGTPVGLSLGCYLMDPALYPHPERFDPGRWLGRSAPPTPMEMAAFGGGPHFCLGYHLAWLEVQQFLVALAQKLCAAKLRPQIPDGPAPREIFIPVRRPSASSRIAFV